MPWGLILKLAPYAIILALLGVVGWQRAEINGEEARQAKAVLEMKDKAQKASDAIIAAQADALAKTALKVNTITERIYHAPVSVACVKSDAIRAGLSGVLDIVAGDGTPAGRGAPAPLHRPAANPKP